MSRKKGKGVNLPLFSKPQRIPPILEPISQALLDWIEWKNLRRVTQTPLLRYIVGYWLNRCYL